MNAFETRLEARGIEQFERSWFVEARYLNQQWEMEAPLAVDRFASVADVSTMKDGFDTVASAALRRERSRGPDRVHELEGAGSRRCCPSPLSR